ncbi:uncharacterized protein [Henckelia pumila]|uniref:uncharacterized protein n=1 Tax=Henckelia pumila TaxID=405737 RepID=UPI003C6E9D55
MGACASTFKVLKDSGDAQPPPVTKEEAAAVVEEEVKEKDVAADDDEAKHRSLGQMLIQENEGEEVLVKIDCKASGELNQEDAETRENETLKSIESAEKTQGKPIQNSNLENVEEKTMVEPVKAVECVGNEDSATDKKPETKKIED